MCQLLFVIIEDLFLFLLEITTFWRQKSKWRPFFTEITIFSNKYAEYEVLHIAPKTLRSQERLKVKSFFLEIAIF